MKRQVIQNFLNLPGLSGIGLIDGRNRPFFFGPDIQLNTGQQDALAQGIQQVIETIPAGFDTFSFRFTHQLVHIYKLDEGLILLVLMADQMAFNTYRSAIRQLTETLMEEPHNAVSTFRLLAGCVTLNSRSMNPDGSTPFPGAPVAIPTEAASPSPGITAVSVADLLAAMNHLSDGATQYLGKIIVANTWKQSRPDQPWLAQFEIQKDGHFALPNAAETITPEQQQWVRDWVNAFLDRGSRTIRNFKSMVGEGGTLSPQEVALLVGNQESSP
ncbi:hypothetical protein GFS31_12110 [Leptolyngbya sp. BL0902]|uniref:hypothetical protein n=1 Tax=Leptolyngbya sp. BL0902 TaxID=1115757 RepID=UPI0018E6DFDD|nr:hypothetical protein [Leptolyngbya sp. BL0902]QQE64530.1 hypothetical protein GFS31_12110 [Leptolyngbya sp. BL0902]